MSLLKISLVQSNLVWENQEQNLSDFSKKIEKIENTDLIILPEMFNSGFTMNAKSVAENMNGNTLIWLKKMAAKKKAAIAGSLVIQENEQFFNRFVWVNPTGEVFHYDKHHLFTLAKEDEVYTAGNEKIIVNYKAWRIRLFVCYDLRFPVWNRNEDDYDLSIYIASWPSKRSVAWKTLLKARAIENMSFVAGVNRVGSDANNLEYSGDSALYNPWGDELSSIEPSVESTETLTLSLEDLTQWRESFTSLKDADSFKLNL